MKKAADATAAAKMKEEQEKAMAAALATAKKEVRIHRVALSRWCDSPHALLTLVCPLPCRPRSASPPRCARSRPRR